MTNTQYISSVAYKFALWRIGIYVFVPLLFAYTEPGPSKLKSWWKPWTLLLPDEMMQNLDIISS